MEEPKKRTNIWALPAEEREKVIQSMFSNCYRVKSIPTIPRTSAMPFSLPDWVIKKIKELH